MSQAGEIDVVGNNPDIPTSFITDDGIAVPIANQLEILGTAVPAGSIPVETTGSGNTVTIEVQTSQAIAASDATQIGLAAFDSDDFVVDANGFVSLSGVLETLTGNSGVATPSVGNINVITANSSVKFTGAAATLTQDFGLSNLLLGTNLVGTAVGVDNVALGRNTMGASVSTASSNSAVGHDSLRSITTGQSNTAVGHQSMEATTSGQLNAAIGQNSLFSLTTGQLNAALGHNSGLNLLTGSTNTFLGASTGTNYTGAESGNILIGFDSRGVLGESNVTRIGNFGVGGAVKQTACFIDGITGVTTSNSQMVSIDSTTGQLGAATISGGTVTSVSGTANQVAVANGTTTPVISLVGPYTPATYTTRGVLIGQGTSSIVALAAGTANTVLRSGGAGANPAYSTNFRVSATDVMTNTSQPCFLAYNANTASDVTGDGTVYVCQFDTESFDNANNFASNTFTAPVTGRYQFSAGMYAAALGAHTLVNLQLVTSGGVLLFFLYCDPTAIANGTNLLYSGSAIVPMTIGDTCNIRLVVSGSTKTVDWIGGGLNANPPYFSGSLIC